MLRIKYILPDVLENLKDRGHTEEDIRRMSVQEAFCEWCDWNGLINWGDKIMYVLDDLREAVDK